MDEYDVTFVYPRCSDDKNEFERNSDLLIGCEIYSLAMIYDEFMHRLNS